MATKRSREEEESSSRSNPKLFRLGQIIENHSITYTSEQLEKEKDKLREELHHKYHNLLQQKLREQYYSLMRKDHQLSYVS